MALTPCNVFLELITMVKGEALRQQWNEWESSLVPITDDVRTHGITTEIQSERYVPHALQRSKS